MVDRSIVVMGNRYVVRWMRFRNSYPALDYLENLTSDAERIRERLLSLVTFMAEAGQLPSAQHGHFLSGAYRQIFEFKPIGHRIFAFIDGTTLYLTSGAPKRSPKAQAGDYERAMNLRAEFYSRKKPKTGNN